MKYSFFQVISTHFVWTCAGVMRLDLLLTGIPWAQYEWPMCLWMVQVCAGVWQTAHASDPHEPFPCLHPLHWYPPHYWLPPYRWGKHTNTLRTCSDLSFKFYCITLLHRQGLRLVQDENECLSCLNWKLFSENINLNIPI